AISSAEIATGTVVRDLRRQACAALFSCAPGATFARVVCGSGSRKTACGLLAFATRSRLSAHTAPHLTERPLIVELDLAAQFHANTELANAIDVHAHHAVVADHHLDHVLRWVGGVKEFYGSHLGPFLSDAEWISGQLSAVDGAAGPHT